MKHFPQAQASMLLILFSLLSLLCLPGFSFPTSANYSTLPGHRLQKRVEIPPFPDVEEVKKHMTPGQPPKDRAIFYSQALFSTEELKNRYNGVLLSETDNGDEWMTFMRGPFLERMLREIDGKPTWTDDELDIAIGRVSQAFAERSSGIVRVVLQENHNPKYPSAWNDYEWPALKKNNDVDKVLAWWVKKNGDNPTGDGTEVWPCDMSGNNPI